MISHIFVNSSLTDRCPEIAASFSTSDLAAKSVSETARSVLDETSASLDLRTETRESCLRRSNITNKINTPRRINSHLRSSLSQFNSQLARSSELAETIIFLLEESKGEFLPSGFSFTSLVALIIDLAISEPSNQWIDILVRLPVLKKEQLNILVRSAIESQQPNILKFVLKHFFPILSPDRLTDLIEMALIKRENPDWEMLKLILDYAKEKDCLSEQSLVIICSQLLYFPSAIFLLFDHLSVESLISLAKLLMQRNSGVSRKLSQIMIAISSKPFTTSQLKALFTTILSNPTALNSFEFTFPGFAEDLIQEVVNNTQNINNIQLLKDLLMLLGRLRVSEDRIQYLRLIFQRIPDEVIQSRLLNLIEEIFPMDRRETAIWQTRLECAVVTVPSLPFANGTIE